MGIAPQAAPRVSHQPSLRPPQFQPSYQALLQISQVLVRQWTPRPLSTMPAIKHSPPLNELHPAVALFSRSALAAPSIEPSLVSMAVCGGLTQPSPPPISPWEDLRTLGLEEPRQAVSHNPASWLKSMSLSKTRPHVASQQVASQSPNTYHKIQSSGMFQASALEKSQEGSWWVFTAGGRI